MNNKYCSSLSIVILLILSTLFFTAGCSDGGSSSSTNEQTSSEGITLSGRAVGATDDVDAVATLTEKNLENTGETKPNILRMGGFRYRSR